MHMHIHTHIHVHIHTPIHIQTHIRIIIIIDTKIVISNSIVCIRLDSVKLPLNNLMFNVW